jgi:hypothetical protein
VRHSCAKKREEYGGCWGMLGDVSAGQATGQSCSLRTFPRSGRRGRRFKSGHPDQVYLGQSPAPESWSRLLDRLTVGFGVRSQS